MTINGNHIVLLYDLFLCSTTLFICTAIEKHNHEVVKRSAVVVSFDLTAIHQSFNMIFVLVHSHSSSLDPKEYQLLERHCHYAFMTLFHHHLHPQDPPSPSFPSPPVPNNRFNQLCTLLSKSCPSPPMCIFWNVCVLTSINKTTTMIAMMQMRRIQKRQQIRA